MADDPTEVIGVLRTHLEETQLALNWAKGYFQAIDLADGYRQNRVGSQRSSIANVIERAYGHVTGYLDAQESDG